MDQKPWREVKEILRAALECDASEQAAFLEHACGDDRALRAEIDELLVAEAKSLPWLDGAAGEVAVEMLVGTPLVGQRIGPYDLVRELGRGGMGAVYLGVRADDQFEQRTAVKLLHRGILDDELLRRFHQERQILASLEHPHIARLLDGGMTGDGLHYFIMEYVEGVPIDAFCDRHRLPLAARLELFRQVCGAVEYAHRHLVVHCDLKPSNILVTEDGMPKLLDFGIARLLGSRHIPRLVTTRLAGLRLMTPEYASPEQVRGERLTTASDTYSLGVLLYKLITGRLPYRLGEATLPEIERVICDREPPRPSTVGDASRELRGDLDNIVAMALRKDPARRYRSVEQLSEDLSRHLTGMPVVARRDTLTYRAGKFVRRHRLGVSAAALVTLSLLLGLAVSAWMAVVATAERRQSEQVLSFLERLFEEADPTRGESLTVRELLDRGTRQFERELADQPAAQARLMGTVGEAYRQLGAYEPAETLLEGALERRRQVFGEDSTELAESLDRLCRLRRDQGQHEEAEDLCRQALALRRQLSEEAPEVADSLNHLATLLLEMGEYRQAETLSRQALDLHRGLPGNADRAIAGRATAGRAIAISHHNLGEALRRQGNYDDAEPALRRAVELYRERLGEEHPFVAPGLTSLALVLQQRGDHQTAERYYRQALDLRRATLGPEHPLVATSLINLAALLLATKQYDDAEPLYRQALALNRKRDERHPEEATVLHHLGALRHAIGDLAGAESFYGQALALRRQLLPPEHPLAASSLVRFGQVLVERGQARPAEELLREGLKIRQLKLAENHWRTERARGLLGACLTALGRFEEAEPLLLVSYRRLGDKYDEQHRQVSEARERLIALYELWSRPDDAEVYRRPS